MSLGMFQATPRLVAKQFLLLLLMVGLLISPFAFSVEKAEAATGLTIHFKKPANWGTPSLFYYDTVPATVTGTTWATAPAMTAETAFPGWFVYTIEGASSAKIIFKDSNGNQLPAANQPGYDRSAESWFDGTNWTLVNPDAPDTVAPSVPTNLASSELTAYSVKLTWTASTDDKGVAGYEVWQNSTKLADSATTSYTVTGLTPVTQYSFSVRAKDAAGNFSAATTAVSVTTPAAPTGLTIHFKKPANWGTPSLFYYDTVPATVTGTTWATAPAMTAETAFPGWFVYTIPGASSAKIIFKDSGTNQLPAPNVAGYDRSAESWFDGTNWTLENPDAPDTAAPSVPTNLASSELTAYSVKLTWTASTDNKGVTGYEVWQNNAKLADSTTTSYTVTGLTPVTEYSFAVRAKDAAGNFSSATTTVSVTTPTAPTGLTIHFKKPANWGTPSLFYYDTVPATVTGTTWATAPVMTAETAFPGWFVYTIVGASSAKIIFKDNNGNQDPVANVAGYDRAAESWFDGTTWSLTNPDLDTTAPSVPTGLAASEVGSVSLTLSWTASTDNKAVTGYEVWQNNSKIGETTNTNFIVQSGLSAQTAYTFAVRAKDAAGNFSATTTEISVTTTQYSELKIHFKKPAGWGAPKMFYYDQKPASVVGTTWDNAVAMTEETAFPGWFVYTIPGATGAKIIFRDSGTNQLPAPTVAGYDRSAESWFDGTNWTLENPDVPDTSAPSVPTNLASSELTATSVKLTWTASTDNKGVTGYEVWQNNAKLADSATTSYTVTGLTPETAYSFAVRAKDAAGNFSSATTAVSVTTPAAPTGLTIHFKKPANWGTPSLFYYDTVPATVTGTTWATAPVMTAETAFPGWFVYTIVGASSAKIIFKDSNGNQNPAPTVAGFDRSAESWFDGTNWTLENPDAPDTAAPTVPTNLASSELTAYSVKLTWTASTDNKGVTGYEVWQNNAKLADSATTSYTVTGLTPETAYSFAVRAKDAAGNFSAATTAVSVTTPAAPTGLTIHFKKPANWGTPSLFYYDTVPATVTGTTWATAPVMTAETAFPGWFVYTIVGASSAKIIFKDSNGNQNPAPTVAGFDRSAESWFDGTNWTLENPDAPDTAAPSVPTDLATSELTAYSVKLTWTASTDNKGVTGYEVWQNNAKLADSTTTSFTVTGLTPETVYSFAVRAKDAAGNFSAATTAVSVTTPVAPPGLTIHFKKPANWGTPSLFYYDTVPATVPGTTWATAPAMTAETAYPGWFVYTIPGATSAKIIFKDSGSNQLPGPNVAGYDRSAESWFDGTNWTLVNPETPVDTTKPTVPSGLLSSDITTSGFKVTWSASTDNVGVSKYEVYLNALLVGEVSTTDYTFTGLNAGTSYQVTVLAKDAAGNKSNSSTALSVSTITIDTTAPSAPTGLISSNATATNVTLSWTASTDNVAVTGYEIFNGTTSVGTSVGNTITLSGLTTGVPYSFTVKAKDAAGNVSAASTALVITLADTVLPTVPSNVTATTITDTTITVSWTASTDNVGVTGYNIYSNTKYVSSTTSTSFVLKNLTPGTSYTITVLAYDAAKNRSALTPAITATTTNTGLDTTAPSKPANVASSNLATTSFTLTWSASTDNVAVTGYEVYRGTTLIGSPTTTSFNVTGLIANTTYSMTVRAVDAAGNKSVASNALSVTTSAFVGTDTVAPTAPTGLASSNITNTGFKVAWNFSTDNVGVTGYNVYRNGTYIATIAKTDYTFTNLTAGTTYNITVLAVDAAKNKSALSSPLSVTTTGAPVVDTTAPTVPAGLVSSNITETGFKVTWTASTDNVGVTGYNVYRNGSYITSVTTTSYTFTGLLSGTNYSIKVLAYDAASNKSAQSTALLVTTSGTTFVDTVAPSVPTGLASSNITATGFRVTWTASTDNVSVKSYNVYRNNTYIATVSGTSYNFSGLAANTAYSIQVMAIDSSNNKSARSTALSVTTAS